MLKITLDDEFFSIVLLVFWYRSLVDMYFVLLFLFCLCNGSECDMLVLACYVCGMVHMCSIAIPMEPPCCSSCVQYRLSIWCVSEMACFLGPLRPKRC